MTKTLFINPTITIRKELYSFMEQPKPYFMDNPEWYIFDDDNCCYRLTNKAPKEAKKSYKEFYADMNGMEEVNIIPHILARE